MQLANDPALDESRLAALLAGTKLSGARAHVLVAAAVRADVVERRVLPALEAGEMVVMERYVDSPLAHLGALGGLDPKELDGLADWATGRLRPDVTVLLDRDPAGLADLDGQTGIDGIEHHWRVQQLLTEMAASDPGRLRRRGRRRQRTRGRRTRPATPWRPHCATGHRHGRAATDGAARPTT